VGSEEGVSGEWRGWDAGAAHVLEVVGAAAFSRLHPGEEGS
jgi:hypothetical protein